MVTSKDIEMAIVQGEQENALFADKSCLDGFAPGPGAPVGRAEKAGELVRALAGGLKKGYATPVVFVYGRTGSGKSTVVRFVCENLPLTYRFVNLRRAKSAFGCAGLILQALGSEGSKSGQAFDLLMDRVATATEALAQDRLFVLVLDEFDALFSDRRHAVSDFVYRLLEVQARLRERGKALSMVMISNNVAAADELDDRVRSRISGAPEVFFDSYAKDEIVAILNDRAQRAFLAPVSDEVIECVAELGSQEHGDARRAIDLLRAAAEMAGLAGEHAIGKKHVDAAHERLQKEKAEVAIARVSYHARVALAGLVRAAFLAPELGWYPTSALYRQYLLVLRDEVRPLTYRRVAELLMEVENLGLAASRVASRGRHGYGREYKLAMPPEIAGNACFAEWWKILEGQKRGHEEELKKMKEYMDDPDLHEYGRRGAREAITQTKARWAEFVGLGVAESISTSGTH